MRIVVLLLLATVGLGCNDKPAASAQPTATTSRPSRVSTLDGALASAIGVKEMTETVPAGDGHGIYLITPDGVWLLNGTEAKRVREVPATQP